MKPALVTLNAPQHVLEAIVDVWRECGRVSEMLVYGWSMEPAIQKGARILVDHRLAEVAVGDVVVFRNGDHLTAHRVARIVDGEVGRRAFITKGDVNEEADGQVEERFVVGRVIEVRNPRSVEGS